MHWLATISRQTQRTPPLDDLSHRLHGWRTDSTGAAMFARWLVQRLGAGRAKLWLAVVADCIVKEVSK